MSKKNYESCRAYGTRAQGKIKCRHCGKSFHPDTGVSMTTDGEVLAWFCSSVCRTKAAQIMVQALDDYSRKKPTVKVPGSKKVELDKTEVDAVLAKYGKLGIRITEDNLLSQFSEHLREISLKEKHKFTKKEILARWESYKERVFSLTTQDIIDLAGFDPLAV